VDHTATNRACRLMSTPLYLESGERGQEASLEQDPDYRFYRWTQKHLNVVIVGMIAIAAFAMYGMLAVWEPKFAKHQHLCVAQNLTFRDEWGAPGTSCNAYVATCTCQECQPWPSPCCSECSSWVSGRRSCWSVEITYTFSDVTNLAPRTTHVFCGAESGDCQERYRTILVRNRSFECWTQGQDLDEIYLDDDVDRSGAYYGVWVVVSIWLMLTFATACVGCWNFLHLHTLRERYMLEHVG